MDIFLRACLIFHAHQSQHEFCAIALSYEPKLISYFNVALAHWVLAFYSNIILCHNIEIRLKFWINWSGMMILQSSFYSFCLKSKMYFIARRFLRNWHVLGHYSIILCDWHKIKQLMKSTIIAFFSKISMSACVKSVDCGHTLTKIKCID